MLNPGYLCECVGVAPGMRVADFGSGSHGWFSHRLMQEVGSEGRVYAVDVRPEALAVLARAHNGTGTTGALETIWSDIEHFGGTSIPHASLDRIFIINVVSELQDVVAAFRESERLLAPQGKIFVVDWARGIHPLAPSALVPPDRVVMAAQETGMLSAEHVFSAGEHHYGIIIGRV